MNFVYSQHALEQIKLRELSKSVLDDVLNEPSTMVMQDDKVTVYKSLLLRGINCIFTESLLTMLKLHLW